jgi:hypothetical protein
MKNPFKVGDMLLCTNWDGVIFEAGKTYQICEIKDDFIRLAVGPNEDYISGPISKTLKGIDLYWFVNDPIPSFRIPTKLDKVLK